MIQGIATERGINRDTLAAINYRMDVRNPETALEKGLVDGLLYSDELMEVLKEQSGNDDLSLVSYSDYTNSYNPSYSSKNKIAVIMASGDIVMGEGGNEIIGSDKFVKTIRKAREDDGIKAIVLRINSPGGSYLASDAIWREVKLAAEVKPVIASMSNYAASGGYYIAMAADTIVAQPTTITGSIGIFSILFNVQELFEDKLGITFDGVNTGRYSDLYASNRPVSTEERAIIQREVESNYDTFIRKAAEGRNMDEAELRSLASGRVWTGLQSMENGLIDVLGGLETAVDIAAEKAGIADEYNLRYYPPQKTVLEELLGMDQASMSQSAIKEELGAAYPIYREVQKLKRLEGVQARTPYSIEIN
jgi:protease-4